MDILIITLNQMVKDLRTGHETSDTGGVLDGDLNAFMRASLSGLKAKDAQNKED